MTDDRRHVHRAFDPALIAGYLRGRRLESVQLLPHGKSNSNYKLLVDGEPCVLRLHTTETAERERAAMQLVSQMVPVPSVLASGDDWTLFSFVPGDHLSAHPECVAAAAVAMARIWTVTFEKRGWVNSNGTIEPFDFGGTSDFGTAILKHPEVESWLGRDAVRALEKCFAAARRTQDRATNTACLVHGDFNPSNVLVQDGTVMAVLDWEFAHSGEPFMDIANLVRNTPPESHQAIRTGLESTGMQLPDDWLARCEFQHLGSYLEFLTTQRADSFKRECAAWILSFIKRNAPERIA